MAQYSKKTKNKTLQFGHIPCSEVENNPTRFFACVWAADPNISSRADFFIFI